MKRALMIIGLAVAMTGASFAVQAEETDVAKVKCSEFIQDKERVLPQICCYLKIGSENCH